MSFDDLDKFLTVTEQEPNPLVAPTPHEVLSQQGRDMLAIISHREIEDAFNASKQDTFFIGGDLRPGKKVQDPAEAPQLDIPVSLTAGGATRDIAFALDYPERLLRSAMAITGVSAASERFGDIRKSQSFWVALLDLTDFTTGRFVVPRELKQLREEQIAGIPSLLTDPDVSTTELRGLGQFPTEVLGTPESLEWIFDLVGSLFVEAKVFRGTRRLAQKGISKLTKEAYSAGDDLAKAGGIQRILGKLSDEELAAISEANRVRQFGKLGTKPKQEVIDGAIGRTFEYIEATKDARIAKGEFITAQRRQAVAKMGAVQRSAQATGEYGPGFAKRLRAAGKTEKAAKAFKPLVEASTKAADDLATLNKTISNFDFGPGKAFTTTNAHEALAKLYEYGELLTRGEVEILRDIFGQDFANALGKFTGKATGVGKIAEAAGKTIVGLANLSRTLQTTGELSFLLRQGNFRAWSRPQEAMRSFAWAARALASPTYATRLDDAMRFSASGKRALQNGLFLGKFGDNVFRLNEAEEVFMAQWLKGVPGIGAVIKPFERGYTVGLNRLRLDWFDEGMDLLEQAGKAGDDKLVKQWANYVNNMTGRADIDNIAAANKVMKSMASTAKKVLFAPKFAASRWNRHKVAAELIFGADTPNAMRSMLAGDTILRWRRYERLAHFATENGMEVETNPLSSDALKIISGDTRFEVLGGDVQIQVLMARIVSGQTKEVDTKLVKDAVALDLAQRYLTNKLNPLWSLIFDKLRGQTAEGEDIDDPKVMAKIIAGKFIPLYLQDLKDKMFHSYEEEGKTIAESLESAIPMSILGFGGAGIQTFAPSARKKYELLINDKAQELHARDFADLTPQLKREVIWIAEAERIEEVELLKEEMGMFQPTRATAARRQKTLNTSFRKIRDGLGKDFRLFEESNVDTGEFSLQIGDVKLNTEQHDQLHKFYIESIKRQLKQFPNLLKVDPKDLSRRIFLQDVVDTAREDAKFEIFLIEQ